MVQFGFAIDALYAPFLLTFGVTRSSAWLRIDDDELEVQFGLFGLTTSVSNVTGYQLSGDYTHDTGERYVRHHVRLTRQADVLTGEAKSYIAKAGTPYATLTFEVSRVGSQRSISD